MTTYFPTVPVELALRNAMLDDRQSVPPLVLIVDDEPLIAETLATILQGHGLATMTAEDADAALEIAELIPPQLLLSDVALPGMDGFALAMQVTRRIPDCEVILFSGQYSTCDVVSMHHAQGHDFLTMVKPVHPVDMLTRVFERLSQHGWAAPNSFRPRPPKAYDTFSLGSSGIRISMNGHSGTIDLSLKSTESRGTTKFPDAPSRLV